MAIEIRTNARELDTWSRQSLGDLARVATLVLSSGPEGRGLSGRTTVAKEGSGCELVGTSPKMTRLRHEITRMAETDFTVLVERESGSGKELVARLVHERSSRHAGPFIGVNCAALVETLLEAELVGIEGPYCDRCTWTPRQVRAGRRWNPLSRRGLRPLSGCAGQAVAGDSRANGGAGRWTHHAGRQHADCRGDESEPARAGVGWSVPSRPVLSLERCRDSRPTVAGAPRRYRALDPALPRTAPSPARDQPLIVRDGCFVVVFMARERSRARAGH